MLWLGIRGRRKIESLERELAATQEALERLQKDFRALDLDMSSQVDRLAGLAKRIQGRRGGRPPNGQENGEAKSEAEDAPLLPGFSRHVL